MPAETLRAPTPETGEFKALSPEPPGAVAARVRGRRPLPHDLRPGDADVLAGGAAVVGRRRLVRAHVRLAPPPLPAGVRGNARSRAVHAQLGPLPGPDGRGRAPSVHLHGARSGAPRTMDRWGAGVRAGGP